MEGIKVSVRVRPISNKETNQDYEDIWNITNNNKTLSLSKKFSTKTILTRTPMYVIIFINRKSFNLEYQEDQTNFL